MRSFLLIPAVVGLVALGAGFLLSSLHHPIAIRDLLLAAILCTASAELALTPAYRRQLAGVLAVFQAGLIGSVLHLMLTVVLAAVIAFAGLAHDKRLFLYVVIACYWASLFAIVRGLVRFIRDESAHAQADAQAKVG